MKYAVVDSQNKFTGVVYEQITSAIISKHLADGHKIIGLNRALVDSGTSGVFPTRTPGEPIVITHPITGEQISTPTWVETPGTLATHDFGEPTTQELKDGLVATLWEVCTAYQAVRLDANGLVGMTYKAQQPGMTKAVANVEWVNALWAEYYTRKTAINAGTYTTSMDFSSKGELPYSYYEAMAQTA